MICVLWCLQHAAELEKKQNDTEFKKQMGHIIQYGNVIQVCVLSSYVHLSVVKYRCSYLHLHSVYEKRVVVFRHVLW